MMKRFFSAFSENKDEHVNQSNWVRLRFWLPSAAIRTPLPSPDEVSSKDTEMSLVKKEVKNVGHVSLETKQIYASIWPDSEDTTAIG